MFIKDDTPLGKAWEGDCADAFDAYAKARGLDLLQNTLGSIMDEDQGTDYLDGEIHIDFTFNLAHKDHVVLINRNTGLDICGFQLMIGVRVGNKHHMFDHPAFVVGITCDADLFRNCYNQAVEEWKKKTEEILGIIEDYYYAILDERNAEE